MTHHSQRIRRWLRRLQGAGEGELEYEVLQGGASGAYTYLVRMEAGPRILKVAEATSAPWVLRRAQREHLFYRDLAPQIPLRVPRLLASCKDGAEASALLLAAYCPPAPPERWQEAHYRHVAQQLASLHAGYWDQTERLARHPWLKRASPTDLKQHLPQAHAAWQMLFEQPRFARLFTAPTQRLITHLLPQAPVLSEQQATFPRTLCHGDCHMDNLLYDDQGHLVWADWQEVGVGCGPEDLAFFMQRAQTAGGRVPHASMMEAYREALERFDRPVSLAALERVVALSELCTRLVYWPSYLQSAPLQGVAEHLERIELLAQGL